MRSTPSVAEALSEAAREFPDSPAVITGSGSHTYRDLHTEARLLADRLGAQGLGEGAGVALQAPNSFEFIVGLVALLHLRAVAVPIPPNITSFEEYELRATLPIEALLTSSPSAEGVVVWESMRLLKFGAPRRPFFPLVPDAAVVRPTSGTTGTSKGVILSHKSILERLTVVQKTLRISTSDRVLWVLPMAYHFIASILLYLRHGAAIVVSESHLADELITSAERHSATMCFGSPAIIGALADLPEHFPRLADLRGFRLAISTSAALPNNIARRFNARHGLNARQIFGIIEVGLPMGDLRGTPALEGSVGHVLEDYEIRIMTEAGEICAAGEIGQLEVRGPGMFDAYVTPAGLRAQFLKNGFFPTLDLAVQNVDGSYSILGRTKTSINFAGVKIFPEEVEEALMEHPGIAACRVLGEPHPQFGELVCAEVVAKSGLAPSDTELKRFCRTRLSTQKIPQVIRFTNEIPMTNTGKIKRR